MPELPEVETVVAFLSPALQDKFIRTIDLPNGYSKVIENGNLSSIINAVKGRKIVRLSRRGKYIVFELSQGFLVFHLRMTGKLLLHSLQKKFDKELSFHIVLKTIRIYIFTIPVNLAEFILAEHWNGWKKNLGLNLFQKSLI